MCRGEGPRAAKQFAGGNCSGVFAVALIKLEAFATEEAKHMTSVGWGYLWRASASRRAGFSFMTFSFKVELASESPVTCPGSWLIMSSSGQEHKVAARPSVQGGWHGEGTVQPFLQGRCHPSHVCG